MDMVKYVISIPLDGEETGETMECGFPDTENMYGFLSMLEDDGYDVSRISIPEGTLI